MDQDCTFMSSLMNSLLKKLDIKINTVAPYNHQSLQTEHGIKYLSNIPTKYIFDTRSVFPLNRTIIFLVLQAFTRSSTMASSGVRENVHPNTNPSCNSVRKHSVLHNLIIQYH